MTSNASPPHRNDEDEFLEVILLESSQ